MRGTQHINCPHCLMRGRVVGLEMWRDGYAICRECGFNAVGWKDLAAQQNREFSRVKRLVPAGAVA